MKILFTRYTLRISFCILSILAPPVVTRCSGPILAPDESRFTLFRQNLDNNSGLLPFNYGEELFNLTEADPSKLDYQRNCTEWKSFCGINVNQTDIYNVQYNTGPAIFLEAYRTGKWKDLASNSFIKWLLKKKNLPSLVYMALAKEAEHSQYQDNRDPWDTSSLKMEMQCEAIALKASNALHQPLPVFLQERFAFQAIKMYYYSSTPNNHDEQLRLLYERHLANSNSIVAAWSLVYYGMRQYNANRRTAILLQAFDRSEEKKKFCSLQLSNDDLSALEKSVPDLHTLSIINIVRAVRNKGRSLREIQSVYRFNPNSKYLPLLITREINKLENWLWSPQMLYFPDNYRPGIEENKNRSVSFKQKLETKDRQYLATVTAFLASICAMSNSHSIFLKLALAHLYNMEGSFTKAEKILLAAGPLTNHSYETQRLIELVITTAQTNSVTIAPTQQKLASFIRKLILLNPAFKRQLDEKKMAIWENEYYDNSNSALSALFILLSHCFEKKGDIVMAGLLYNRANIAVNNYDGSYGDTTEGYRNIAFFDRSASAIDINLLLAFKHKKNKTPFEQLIMPRLWGSDDQYRDLKGTILFRQGKFREALAVFETINSGFWEKRIEFKENLPITSVTHTGKMIPSEKTSPTIYKTHSKLLIVKDIVQLLTQIPQAKNNEERAILNYRLANAYFNTSYNGKAWVMFSYGKSVAEFYNTENGNYNWAWFNFYPNKIKYADYYYCCRDAISTYKKALALTANMELAAKCLLALSACDIIRHNYLQNLTERSWHGDNNNYIPAYLQKLRSEYSSTYAFREAAIECPDVKKFITKQ